jgi:hypothetical protein
MKYAVSKIEAAVDQLDWAIRLFLDHRAYIPAITLSGAAEEIVGHTLGDQSAFALLKQRFAEQTGLPESIISQLHLNLARNWVKHWLGMKDAETIHLELETEAIQYILRAMSNLIAHDGSLPSEGPRFFHWLEVNREDLHAV